ncbi:MAG: chemotaxis protein CheW [Acetivibrionales bacterium]|jgi:purine-binding chemotaxis protein CheW
MSELQVLVFDLNGQPYGAEASQVLQIIRYEEPEKEPRMPKFIEGVLSFRDSALPVIDLVKRFNLGESAITKKTKILVAKIEDRYVGFIVNDVAEIVEFAADEVDPVPAVEKTGASAYLKRVGKKNDKLIFIIDLENVLNEKEIKRLKR